MTGPSRVGRLCFGPWIALSSLVLGIACTYSIVDGDRIRRDELDRIAASTMAVRGLTTAQKIEPRVVSQAELYEVLEEALLSDWTREEIQRAERGMVAIGLWPRQRDLLSVYLDVLSQEVAGLYVPHDKALYLVGDFQTPVSVRIAQGLVRRDLVRELILSHEIVHLLQDEAFPRLLAPDRFLHAQDDLAYALQASFEGDATHYGLLAIGVTGDALPRPDELRKSMEAASEPGRDTPAIVSRTLVFPYAEGYRLSLAEGQQLLERPPISTEQVLHDDKRLQPFQAFDLRTLDGVFPSRCRRVYENSVGELALSVLFVEADRDASEAIWQGWDGDRYLVVDCSGQLEFVWATSWDTEEDALEFALAYDAIGSWVTLRKGSGGRPMVMPRGREVWIATSSIAGAIEQFEALSLRQRVSSIPEIRAFYE